MRALRILPVLALICTTLACGVKGDPLPPLHDPEKTEEEVGASEARDTSSETPKATQDAVTKKKQGQ